MILLYYNIRIYIYMHILSTPIGSHPWFFHNHSHFGKTASRFMGHALPWRGEAQDGMVGKPKERRNDRNERGRSRFGRPLFRIFF